MLSAKLGVSSLEGEEDEKLANDMFSVLEAVETDMTLFFRLLADVQVDGGADEPGDTALMEPLRRAFYTDAAFAPEHVARMAEWLRRYGVRVRRDQIAPGARRERMNRANPKYVLRNYLAQLAIDALAEGDSSVLERLMKVLERPYDEQPENDELADRRPEWARNRPGCSALSCSS
jgi:uncharacterized protein YdiU (UPF0061 family)